MENREQQILSQIYKSQAQNVWCPDWTSRTMNGGHITKRVCVHAYTRVWKRDFALLEVLTLVASRNTTECICSEKQ